VCCAQTTECPLLPVLVRLLINSPPDRMAEVALGILANLATHAGMWRSLLAQEGLVAVVLDRFLTSIHAPTLTEVRRRAVGKLSPAWALPVPVSEGYIGLYRANSPNFLRLVPA
jgi:hypothetical protein